MEMIDAIKKKLEEYEGAAYPNGPYMQTVRALIKTLQDADFILRNPVYSSQIALASWEATLKQVAKELGVKDE